MRNVWPAAVVAATLCGPVHSSVGGKTTLESDPPVVLDPIIVKGQRPPIPKLRVNPHYPMQARHRWEEGCVVLQFTVRPDGKTDDFAILESKPLGVFEKSVIGAVYRWRYAPSSETRTLVETFQFRNPQFGASPRYTSRSAVKQYVGTDGNGNKRYNLEMMLQGYSPPKCTKGPKT